MTEIFEIGVSLALQDGVCDAIAQARHDVTALEQAVRESGISLRSLREVGARSASVAFGAQRREAAEGPAKRAVQDVTPRAEAAVEPRSEPQAAALGHMAVAGAQAAPSRVEKGVALPLEATDASEAVRADAVPGPATPSDVAVPVRETAALPGAGRVADVVAPMSRVNVPAREPAETAPIERVRDSLLPERPFANAPVAVAPLARSEDARQVGAAVAAALPADPRQDDGPVSAREMTQAAAPQVVREAAQTPLAAVQTPADAAAPANRDVEAAKVTASVQESFGVRPGAPGRGAEHMTLVSALRLSGGVAPVMQGEGEPADPAGHVAAPDDGAAFGKPAMQTASPPALPPRAARGQVTAPGARERSTGQPGAGETGPNEGDVFLDGMLVGRWMSRFLNREAGRASAGPTGFDARRGRLLPGVTVGN